VQEQLQYVGEELARLEGKMLSSVAVKDAVANGMTQAVGDPKFWDEAFKAMGERTTTAAGGFILGGVRGLLSKVFWFGLAGIAVYIAGGWGALVSMFKLIFGIEVIKP
jgi:hypothetical protein